LVVKPESYGYRADTVDAHQHRNGFAQFYPYREEEVHGWHRPLLKRQHLTGLHAQLAAVRVTQPHLLPINSWHRLFLIDGVCAGQGTFDDETDPGRVAAKSDRKASGPAALPGGRVRKRLQLIAAPDFHWCASDLAERGHVCCREFPANLEWFKGAWASISAPDRGDFPGYSSLQLARVRAGALSFSAWRSCL